MCFKKVFLKNKKEYRFLIIYSLKINFIFYLANDIQLIDFFSLLSDPKCRHFYYYINFLKFLSSC